MSFDDLIIYKKKINSTLNIFNWLDDINTIQDTKNNSMLFLLRIGIFFYFVCLMFLFHFLYRVIKKQLLRRKYYSEISKYAKQNGYNSAYWRKKVNETIKQEELEFFQKNKINQELKDSDY